MNPSKIAVPFLPLLDTETSLLVTRCSCVCKPVIVGERGGVFGAGPDDQAEREAVFACALYLSVGVQVSND